MRSKAPCDCFGDRGIVGGQAVDILDPVLYTGGNLGERRRPHAILEHPDVVLTPVAGAFSIQGVRVPCDVPDRRHRHPVDLPNLGDGQQRLALAVALASAPTVDPLGGVSVAAHLEVLLELPVANRAVVLEEPLNLAQGENVTIGGGRVMRLVDPDAAPDWPGFDRIGQAAAAAAQRLNLAS